MQKLAEVCIKRPVFATMIVMALVVVGAASWFRLGVDRFPAVDLPTVAVRTTLPGASPEEVESQVSDVVEEVVNTVEGIEQLRSISFSGQSVVIATFALERDIEVAAQDIRDKVQGVIRRLPREADPPVVSKVLADSEPAITIALDAAEDADNPYEGAVALGCVIRGDTIHFEIVSFESSRGLMEISRTRGVPIGNGILTVDNDAQAWMRAKVEEGDKGGDAARAALALIRLKRRLAAG